MKYILTASVVLLLGLTVHDLMMRNVPCVIMGIDGGHVKFCSKEHVSCEFKQDETGTIQICRLKD